MRILIGVIALLLSGSLVANDACIDAWKQYKNMIRNSKSGDSPWLEFAENKCEDKDFIVYKQGWIYLESAHDRVENINKAYEIFLSLPDNFNEQDRFLGLATALNFLSVLDPKYKEELKNRIDRQLELNPSSDIAKNYLADYYFHEGSYLKSVGLYEELVNRTDYLPMYRNFVISLEETGRHSDSLNYLNELFVLAHEQGINKQEIVYTDVWLMYSAALSFASLGKAQEARSFLALVLTYNDSEKGSARFSKYFNEIKSRLLSTGLYKESA